MQAIQLTWGTVKQLLGNDSESVVTSALGLIQSSKLNMAIVQVWRLPLCGFATPNTWSGTLHQLGHPSQHPAYEWLCAGLKLL
jgi:hypothetical protein